MKIRKESNGGFEPETTMTQEWDLERPIHVTQDEDGYHIECGGGQMPRYEVREQKFLEDAIAELVRLVTRDAIADEAREWREKKCDAWTQTPPTEQGMYWMWHGDPDGAPFPVSVLMSGTSGKCFLPMDQWGWTHPQDVDGEDLAGTWWLPLVEPLPPETAN